MRDDNILTAKQLEELVYSHECTVSGEAFEATLERAARLGAERAMQAPDGDLPEMLAHPALERLRDWYQIGPAQQAALDTLVGWVREKAAIVEVRHTTPTNEYGANWKAEAIRRGEEG